MNRVALCLALAIAAPALADNPADSNGWRWMIGGLTETPVCLGGGINFDNTPIPGREKLFQKMRCLWRGAGNALFTSAYENGAFPAPASWEGTLTSAPSAGSAIMGRGTKAEQWRFLVAARGTDNGVWLRDVQNDVPAPWTPLGGVAKSRPMCATTITGEALCAVQGTDDGFWVRARAADGKWNEWKRIDDLDGKPRVGNVTSGVQIFATPTTGALWRLAHLGKPTTPGKRELFLATSYKPGETKTKWTRVGEVRAAADSDLNCQVNRPVPNTFIRLRCTAVTLEQDVNLIGFNSQGTDLAERILPKPALYPVYGATYVIFTSARANTAVFAVGIRTRHNHFWLQQLQSPD